MSKINLLDANIYNRIAAGEVVERPMSIVKELIENSIDAGAGKIIIEIEGGGIKRISISDDGEGIAFEDLTKAFLPHATSKISAIDDLDRISTLGFRGEALASIGSVSQVILTSKTKDSEAGGEITVQGGKINKPLAKGCPNGTYISVANLFYNIPVRAKFLKNVKTEESYITNLISRIILANPNLSFKYSCEGKLVYQTQGKGLDEAIYAIYGKEAINNIIALSSKNANFTVSGYISTPAYVKPNKTYQTLIINGRYIINSLVSAAVYNAYENYIMKGKFPFFVLNIQMPFEDVDVNVHPNKLDVRFVNSNAVYMAINNCVASALLKSNKIIDVQLSSNANPIITQPLPRVSGHSFNEQKSQNSSFLNGTMQNIMNNTMQDDNPFEQSKQIKIIDGSYIKLQDKTELKDDDGVFYNMLNKMRETEQSQSIFSEGNNYNIADYNKIGTLFKSYIIIEKGENVFFIDQHAAHERLLYDNFSKEFESKNINMQDLLIPYNFKVNSLEDNFIKNNLEEFNKLGFIIEPFGNLSYRIITVPVALSHIDLKAFMDDCLKNLNKMSNNNKEIKLFLATTACKAAVKAGKELNTYEIESLLKLITSQTVLLCPHGRPICVKLKKDEVDKWFKRIL